MVRNEFEKPGLRVPRFISTLKKKKKKKLFIGGPGSLLLHVGLHVGFL